MILAFVFSIANAILCLFIYNYNNEFNLTYKNIYTNKIFLSNTKTNIIITYIINRILLSIICNLIATIVISTLTSIIQIKTFKLTVIVGIIFIIFEVLISFFIINIKNYYYNNFKNISYLALNLYNYYSNIYPIYFSIPTFYNGDISKIKININTYKITLIFLLLKQTKRFDRLKSLRNYYYKFSIYSLLIEFTFLIFLSEIFVFELDLLLLCAIYPFTIWIIILVSYIRKDLSDIFIGKYFTDNKLYKLDQIKDNYDFIKNINNLNNSNNKLENCENIKNHNKWIPMSNLKDNLNSSYTMNKNSLKICFQVK